MTSMSHQNAGILGLFWPDVRSKPRTGWAVWANVRSTRWSFPFWVKPGALLLSPDSGFRTQYATRNFLSTTSLTLLEKQSAQSLQPPKMRKKDRRAHNPVLKPSSARRTVLHGYFHLFRLFMAIVSGLILFTANPYSILAVKLVAADAGVKAETAAFALVVYLFQNFALFFCLGKSSVSLQFYRLCPKLLPLHKILHPPTRYHRTHISHMRLDRMSKWYYSYKDAWAYQAKTRQRERRERQQAHHDKFADSVKLSSSDTVPLLPLDSDRHENGDSGAGEEESSEPADSDDDSVPDLDEVTDYESDYSDSDDEDTAGYLHHKSPASYPSFAVPNRAPGCLSSRRRRTGGGGRGRSAAPASDADEPINISDTDEPIDINLTSDDESPQVFVPEEWLGVGKVWSDTFPTAVKRARNAARFIPPAVRDGIIPDSKCTVNQVLARPLPEPVDTPDTPAHATDSAEPPSIGTVTAATWHDTLISAVPYLSDVRSYFNNGWLSGATSIRFPHLPHLYPLWTENLLFDVKTYLAKRSRWQHATEWLEIVSHGTLATAYAHVDDLVSACRDVLEVIPWDAVVPGLSPSLPLAQ
ncbi:hypothetical protein FB451DRAFT_1473365 [Mycena latifolia]|nr:hypothetical protein FB451DRAFT_1473365 [Mycena latifolia]